MSTGERRSQFLLPAIAGILAMLFSCDGCPRRPHRGDTPMCGKCDTAAACGTGLTCLMGVCETAPPSCHVRIGL